MQACTSCMTHLEPKHSPSLMYCDLSNALQTLCCGCGGFRHEEKQEVLQFIFGAIIFHSLDDLSLALEEHYPTHWGNCFNERNKGLLLSFSGAKVPLTVWHNIFCIFLCFLDKNKWNPEPMSPLSVITRTSLLSNYTKGWKTKATLKLNCNIQKWRGWCGNRNSSYAVLEPKKEKKIMHICTGYKEVAKEDQQMTCASFSLAFPVPCTYAPMERSVSCTFSESMHISTGDMHKLAFRFPGSVKKTFNMSFVTAAR